MKQTIQMGADDELAAQHGELRASTPGQLFVVCPPNLGHDLGPPHLKPTDGLQKGARQHGGSGKVVLAAIVHYVAPADHDAAAAAEQSGGQESLNKLNGTNDLNSKASKPERASLVSSSPSAAASIRSSGARQKPSLFARWRDSKRKTGDEQSAKSVSAGAADRNLKQVGRPASNTHRTSDEHHHDHHRRAKSFGRLFSLKKQQQRRRADAEPEEETNFSAHHRSADSMIDSSHEQQIDSIAGPASGASPDRQLAAAADKAPTPAVSRDQVKNNRLPNNNNNNSTSSNYSTSSACSSAAARGGQSLAKQFVERQPSEVIEFKFDLIVDAAPPAAEQQVPTSRPAGRYEAQRRKLLDNVNELVESFALDSNDVCLTSAGSPLDECRFDYIVRLARQMLTYSFELLQATNNGLEAEATSGRRSVEISAMLFQELEQQQQQQQQRVRGEFQSVEDVDLARASSAHQWFNIVDLLRPDGEPSDENKDQQQQPTTIEFSSQEELFACIDSLQSRLKLTPSDRRKSCLVLNFKLVQQVNGGLFSNRMCLINYDSQLHELKCIFESIFDGQALSHLKRRKIHLRQLELELSKRFNSISCLSELEKQHHHVASLEKLIQAEWFLYKQLSSALIKTLFIVHVHKLAGDSGRAADRLAAEQRLLEYNMSLLEFVCAIKHASSSRIRRRRQLLINHQHLASSSNLSIGSLGGHQLDGQISSLDLTLISSTNKRPALCSSNQVTISRRRERRRTRHRDDERHYYGCSTNREGSLDVPVGATPVRHRHHHRHHHHHARRRERSFDYDLDHLELDYDSDCGRYRRRPKHHRHHSHSHHHHHRHHQHKYHHHRPHEFQSCSLRHKRQLSRNALGQPDLVYSSSMSSSSAGSQQTMATAAAVDNSASFATTATLRQSAEARTANNPNAASENLSDETDSIASANLNSCSSSSFAARSSSSNNNNNNKIRAYLSQAIRLQQEKQRTNSSSSSPIYFNKLVAGGSMTKRDEVSARWLDKRRQLRELDSSQSGNSQSSSSPSAAAIGVAECGQKATTVIDCRQAQRDSEDRADLRTQPDENPDDVSDVVSVVAEPPKQLRLEEFLNRLSSAIAPPLTTSSGDLNSEPLDSRLLAMPDEDEEDCKSHSSILDHLSSLASESNNRVLNNKCQGDPAASATVGHLQRILNCSTQMRRSSDKTPGGATFDLRNASVEEKLRVLTIECHPVAANSHLCASPNSCASTVTSSNSTSVGSSNCSAPGFSGSPTSLSANYKSLAHRVNQSSSLACANID